MEVAAHRVHDPVTELAQRGGQMTLEYPPHLDDGPETAPHVSGILMATEFLDARRAHAPPERAETFFVAQARDTLRLFS